MMWHKQNENFIVDSMRMFMLVNDKIIANKNEDRVIFIYMKII